METTSVMFVENTPFGVLNKRLQECEDRLGQVTGRRVRMVETAGAQLSQILPNTNPWSGAKCAREDCHTCNQGGNSKRKEDCFKRNILYESRCGVCEDKVGGGGNKDKKRKFNEKLEDKNVYVGESSRSLYERTAEHVRDGRKKEEDSHIAKHWQEYHQGEEMPEFRFKIVKSF